MTARLRILGLITFVITLTATSTGALAVDGATAPYNEAVRNVDGKRVVEVAAVPDVLKFMVARGRTPDELGAIGFVLMEVETPMGLMDCANLPYYHPKVCSPTTFGKVKRERQWAVKLAGHWQLCIGRLKPAKCIPLVQDGVLRALPSSPLE